MKRFQMLGLAALLAVSGSVQAGEAPSAESIVEKCLEALGGRDAWEAIETVHWQGRYSTFSSEHPFQLYRQRPNLYRFESKQADRSVVAVFDGQRAWWQSELIPFSEVPWPTHPARVYARGFQADSEFFYSFLDSANRVASVKASDVDGAATWELQVVLRGGLEETWHLDAETDLPLLRISRAGYATNFDKEQRVYFYEWKAVEGVQFPHFLETEVGNQFGEMVVEKIHVNPELGNHLFAFPIEPPMQRLAGLVGEWTVKTASRQMPTEDFLFQDDEGTSKIESLYDGNVLRETLSYHFYDRPRNVERTYSFDQFRNLLTVMHVDDLTHHPVLLRGSAEGESFTLDNLNTGTEWGLLPGMTMHHRQVLKDLQGDRFVVEWQVSVDAGAHWATLARSEYTRSTHP